MFEYSLNFQLLRRIRLAIKMRRKFEFLLLAVCGALIMSFQTRCSCSIDIDFSLWNHSCGKPN